MVGAPAVPPEFYMSSLAPLNSSEDSLVSSYKLDRKWRVGTVAWRAGPKSAGWPTGSLRAAVGFHLLSLCSLYSCIVYFVRAYRAGFSK